MTTNTATHPVEDYLARVLTALGDLPTAERDDLVEDLDLHLREVAAETDGSLEDRLGSPEAYAAELRSSAGLTAAPPRRPGLLGVRARSAVAAALSHPRTASLRAFLATLRPGWWVLRGYLLVAVPSLLCGDVPSSLPIPDVNGPWFGAVLVCAAVVASIWVGLRRPRVGEHYLVAALNLTLVVLSLFAVAHVRDHLRLRAELAHAAFATAEPAPSEYTPYLLSPNGRITNIYPYDAKGHPLTGVRLFDESGNPINLPTQPDLYGRGLVNQFTTTPKGKPIRNSYPVRQITVPSGQAVQPPTAKVVAPITTASPKPHAARPHSTKRHARHRHHHAT